MNAPVRIRPGSDPEMIAFVEALARAQVARDITALRAARQQSAASGMNGECNADGHLRPVQQ